MSFTPSLKPDSTFFLYVDTTTNFLMVGLSVEGQMVFKYKEAHSSHRYHSSVLIPIIQKGLAQVNLSLERLTGIGVNIGPGSFTGIRTGITTVRTMAQFLEVPVYAFNSFELLAGEDTEEPWAIYLDALRGSAYHASLGYSESGPAYDTEPRLVSLRTTPTAFPGRRTMVSVAINPFFSKQSVVTVESLKVFTPDVMLRLTQTYPTRFKRHWKELFPLYLQEPNITLRNPEPGTLK